MCSGTASFLRHPFPLTVSTSSIRRAEPSLKHAYFLGVQCGDGHAGCAIPLYNILVVQKSPSGSSKPVRALGPVRPSILLESEPAHRPRGPAYSARDTECRLARYSHLFFLPSHFQAFLPLFGDVLARGALQAFTHTEGCVVQFEFEDG